MATMSPESLKFIVNHVTLPPNLPQKAEEPDISQAGGRDLIALLKNQLENYCRQVDNRSSSVQAGWASVEFMLDRCTLLLSSPCLSADLLVSAFQSLDTTSELYDTVIGTIELTSTLSQPFNPPFLSQSSKRSAHPAQRRGISCL